MRLVSLFLWLYESVRYASLAYLSPFTSFKSGADMATSSIFHNVNIDTLKKAEAFVAALETSEKEPVIRVNPERHSIVTDPVIIRQIMETNRKNRERI